MFSYTTVLSIRLTETVVPLRSAPSRHAVRPHHEIPSEGSEADPPAVVRGLLTLRLAKPTKVSSIELKLRAKASTHCTKGVGPDPVDVTERYNIHSASTLVFRAGAAPQQRAPSCTSTKSRVHLDGGTHTDRVGGEEGEVPSAATHNAQSFSARQSSLGIDDGRDARPLVRLDQIPTGPAPPYPDSAGRRFSFSSISRSFTTGRLRSITISSRATESANPPCHSPSSPTSDAPLPSPSSSIHSMHDFVPECDSESSDDDSILSPDDVAYYGLSRVAASSSSRSPEQDRRGRSRSRLSFGNVVQIFDAVKDRLRSRSPRYEPGPHSDEQEERGRSLFKGKGKAQTSINEAKHELLESDVDESFLDENEPNGDGWVVFPQGTYTYPIFFTIPNNSPPTMRTDHGSLIWKVKSKVNQPSASKPKITAQKEVVVVCVPRDDDLEDVNGIDVQRQWEDQLQYRIQVAGRGFPVGGQMPFQLTITPLAKAKVHCILVYLDERTEYYTRNESHARSDAIRRTTLLTVKHSNLDERQSEPILPLSSDKPDRFRKSPLYRFLMLGEDEREVASSFMGLGPWTIRHLLRVPESCSKLHPSNRAKGSNVMISHTLKTVLRVEREDGTGTVGRKKLYDIVILTPIQILSCRCTSAWTALPRYEEVLGVGSGEDVEASLCPCRTYDQAKTRTDSHMGDIPEHVMLTTGSNEEASEIWPLDSLAVHTHLHEQLMSGLVSERGEAPPSYEHASAVCVQ